MKKHNANLAVQPTNPKQPEKKKGNGLMGRIIRRFFLVLFTVIIMAVSALVMVLNMVFNGPSPTARNQLTMTLIEASATKWVPALFIGEDTVAEIRASINVELEDDVTDINNVIIQMGEFNVNADEWANYPDGIRIESVDGDTYNAKVMIVRDPSQVYLGISTHEGFSTSIPGKRLTAAMEDEGAIAGINGGAFNDDGSSNSYVGTLPAGLVYSEGECVWTSGKPSETSGFAGFTKDNILVVHKDNISQAQAEELNIRDGCCFGPVLIMNGEINMEAYNKVSGLNPRTGIGQRADGAVIFVCIDGRQPSSMGGEYKDVIDIMVEYGAINACNMDGGSSTVMMYRDTYGLYGEAGQVQIMNSYSLLQTEPRKMPDFWMVRPAKEG
ncbi:MAG: phosphodiester glycosidase family protein [Oscillospiraceae bacterium]|nr:phosphodiester glycosidase family protein [Oscillospiraceae bacterium]